MQLETPFLVYALLDPDTEEVRYIGKSCSGMRRPKCHLQPHAFKEARTHKERWIAKLVAMGKKPVIHVLSSDLQDDEHACEVEVASIALFRSIQCDDTLTNASDGGDAGPSMRGADHPMYGKHHTPDAIERMRVARLGFKHTDEAKALISISARHKHSKEHRLKISAKRFCPVRAFDANRNFVGDFESHGHAALALGMCRLSVGKAVRTGKLVKGHYLVSAEGLDNAA